MEQRYSIAIVGCGPAGLSAALNARIRKKSLILFGENGVSNKVSRPASIKNYLGMPSVSGEELKEAFLQHILEMGITITNAHIDGIYPMGGYFVLSSGSKMYEAKAVILATGAKASNLIPGEQQLLGNGVSYCATCDGLVYEGRTVAVVAYDEREEEDVLYLAKIARKVVFLPQYRSSLVGRNVETVSGKPVGVKKLDDGLCLSLENGETVIADGIFLLRDGDMSPTGLLPGLNREKNFIKVDRMMRTNVEGCFAAGDCVGAPFQYIKAAGEGNIAAHSAVAYLAQSVLRD